VVKEALEVKVALAELAELEDKDTNTPIMDSSVNQDVVKVIVHITGVAD
tara:strand:+ start:162 stop:308 length:147 start_codon:yes stop_codon:yes gene_type:complete